MENFSLLSFEQGIDYNKYWDGFISKNIIIKEFDIVFIIDAMAL